MTKAYLGAICGSEGSYGIVFKDFPGCTSSAATLEEIVRMGREALQGHIEVMVEHGEAVPEPTSHRLDDVIDWLDDDPDDPLREQWVKLVPIEVDVASPGRDAHIDVPQGLLNEIGQVANDPRQFVIDASRRELERLRKSA
ncbi:MAG: type II toxin-antitoxin system HicB family antitoxin [Allosphingosinicella sp.]